MNSASEPLGNGHGPRLPHYAIPPRRAFHLLNMKGLKLTPSCGPVHLLSCETLELDSTTVAEDSQKIKSGCPETP